jgi:hypothetical protein
MKITPGSIVSGKSGKEYLVDRVEGDIIHSGTVKFLASAVLNVIPPVTSFKLGDRVRYTGTDRNLQHQYAGELTIWEISKHDDGYACLKTDGRVTSWILFEELELAIDPPDCAQTVPSQPQQRISIGDAVVIRSNQQRGRIALWYRNRSKAVIEFEDDTLSDWVPSSELMRISDGAIEATPEDPLIPLPANWKPTISPSDDERDELS